jgi:rhamnose transport system ATP-binding protein
MPASFLRLANISKSFAAARALVDVSFEVLPAEVHGLVGENGAGKSTLVQVMTGAQRPDAGTIELNGQLVDRLTPARARQLGISCTYQHPALFPDLSVAENIALRLQRPRPFCRVDWKSQRQRAIALLQRIGAGISPDTAASDLSMPEQQLVEIACALGVRARIIIMDEPTASLTQREQRLLLGVVRDLRREGLGVVYVSHRLEEIFELADRVTVLRDGQRVTTCPVRDLSERRLIGLMVGREVTVAPAKKRVPGGVVLSAKNLGCSTSGVRKISFELRAGEILGLAGLVGAGRTELARSLFGITPVDEGEIQMDGQRIVIGSPRSAVRHRIAYVPEDRLKHGIIPDLPIDQNVTMASHQKLFPRGWLRPDTERSLALESIRALDIKPPSPQILACLLSGGNQQKVSVARWLATAPKVLILDEPTQGVDVGAKSEIHRIICELAGQGLAVLLISSDLPELLALSDRIGVMRAGTLVSLLPANTDPHDIMAAAFGSTSNAV